MGWQNPVLKHITDYLIEEVSAEEEELLGRSGGDAEEGPREANPAEVTVERDEKLLKVTPPPVPRVPLVPIQPPLSPSRPRVPPPSPRPP